MPSCKGLGMGRVAMRKEQLPPPSRSSLWLRSQEVVAVAAGEHADLLGGTPVLDAQRPSM